MLEVKRNVCRRNDNYIPLIQNFFPEGLKKKCERCFRSFVSKRGAARWSVR